MTKTANVESVKKDLQIMKMEAAMTAIGIHLAARIARKISAFDVALITSSWQGIAGLYFFEFQLFLAQICADHN